MKMDYNFNEFISKNYINFDVEKKNSEKNFLIITSFVLLNKSKFDTPSDILRYNPDLNTFYKNNRRDIVAIHYGNSLKNDDYFEIIKSINQYYNDKLKINMENVNVTKYDNKTIDANKNTASAIVELFDEDDNLIKINEQEDNKIKYDQGNEQISKIETVNMPFLSEIEFSNLNSLEKQLYMAATDYASITGDSANSIAINFSKMQIITSEGVKQIINSNGEFIVNDDRVFDYMQNDGQTNQEKNTNELGKAKVLTLNNSYSKYQMYDPYSTINAA